MCFGSGLAVARLSAPLSLSEVEILAFLELNASIHILARFFRPRIPIRVAESHLKRKAVMTFDACGAS